MTVCTVSSEVQHLISFMNILKRHKSICEPPEPPAVLAPPCPAISRGAGRHRAAEVPSVGTPLLPPSTTARAVLHSVCSAAPVLPKILK